MQELGDKFPPRKACILGAYLGVAQSKLQEIQDENCYSHEKDFRDVIDYWLNSDPNKSWAKLAEAVESSGHGDIAENIRIHFNLPEPGKLLLFSIQV